MYRWRRGADRCESAGTRVPAGESGGRKRAVKSKKMRGGGTRCLADRVCTSDSAVALNMALFRGMCTCWIPRIFHGRAGATLFVASL